MYSRPSASDPDVVIADLEWVGRAFTDAEEIAEIEKGADLLVVEDNTMQRKLYHFRAKKAGLSVVLVESGTNIIHRPHFF